MTAGSNIADVARHRCEVCQGTAKYAYRVTPTNGLPMRVMVLCHDCVVTFQDKSIRVMRLDRAYDSTGRRWRPGMALEGLSTHRAEARTT